MTDPTSAPTDKTDKTGGSPGAPIRILIAEDQALLRTTLAALLEAEPGMSVVGLAEDGARAVALATELRPDVVLMDIQMPGLTGIEATRRICADPTLAATRVLILTMFEIDDYVLGALRAGACGFLLKDASPEEIIRAVIAASAGGTTISPAATSRLVTRHLRSPQTAQAPDVTEAEQAVLTLLCEGYSNAEIAEQLVVAESTVKTHVSHLMKKYDVPSRLKLVVAVHKTQGA